MFITVSYRDVPELSSRRKSDEEDVAVERILLVNPDCPVRILLEYIRNKCKLGIFTTFDLCDETGALKSLFNLPTYAYATELFEHKRNYYIVVLKMESDRRISVLPQLNWDSKLYQELKARVNKFMVQAAADSSSKATTPLDDSKASKDKKTPASPPKKKK